MPTPRFYAGERVSAAAFNALAEEVSRLRAELDLIKKHGDAMPVMLRARVAAVRGAAPGSLLESAAQFSGVSYDLQPIGRGPDAIAQAVVPRWRPAENGRIRVARIGDEALIVRMPSGEPGGGQVVFGLVGEPIVFETCG